MSTAQDVVRELGEKLAAALARAEKAEAERDELKRLHKASEEDYAHLVSLSSMITFLPDGTMCRVEEAGMVMSGPAYRLVPIKARK